MAPSGMQGSDRALMIFQRLGIGTDFLRSHLNDTEGVFNAVADAVSKINSPAERTNILMELLSRSGSDASNAFREGSKGLREFASDMERLGDVTDVNQASLGHSFTTLSHYLQAASDGMEKAAATPILQALEAHSETAKSGIIDLAESVDGPLKKGVQNVVGYLSAHAGDIEGLFKGALRLLQEGKAPAFDAIKGAIQFLLEHKGDIKSGIEEIGRDVLALGGALKTAAEATISATKATHVFIDDSIDKLTETDPDKAGGHPYASLPNLKADAVSKAGDAGLSSLRAASAGFSDAQAPLLAIMSQVSKGAIGLHIDDAAGVSDTSAANDASSESLALRAAQSQMRRAVETAHRMSISGTETPQAIAIAVDRVKAFADELARASALVGKWQEREGESGDRSSYPQFQAALDSFRRADSNARSAIQNIGASAPIPNISVGAPGAGNAIGTAGTNFSASLSPAASTLNLLNLRALSVIDQFQVMYTTLGKLNPAFASLITGATTTASSHAGASAPGAPNRSQGITINGGITTPPIDVHDATTQIAAKLQPAIRDLAYRIKSDLEAAALALRTQGGL